MTILAEHKLTHCKVVKGNMCTVCKVAMKNEEQFYTHAQQHGFQVRAQLNKLNNPSHAMMSNAQRTASQASDRCNPTFRNISVIRRLMFCLRLNKLKERDANSVGSFVSFCVSCGDCCCFRGRRCSASCVARLWRRCSSCRCTASTTSRRPPPSTRAASVWGPSGVCVCLCLCVHVIYCQSVFTCVDFLSRNFERYQRTCCQL